MNPIVQIKRHLELLVNVNEMSNLNLNSLKIITDVLINSGIEYESIIFDMSVVEYVDSSGIGFLESINKKTHKEVILKNCHSSLISLLETLDLKDQFKII